MITPFRSVAFKMHEPVTKEQVDAMQTNLQWLSDNTPRGRFIQENGRPVDVRSVLVCGSFNVPPSKKESSYTRSVSFGQAFYVNCNPNVTTGIISDSEPRVWVSVSGPGGRIVPSSSGFEVTVTVDEKTDDKEWARTKPFSVNWQAFGYREANNNDL